MNYLSEETLSKMPLHRLKNIRRGVLAQIHSKSGYYTDELKLRWMENKDYLGSQEESADYAYRDLVNKYYDRQVEALAKLVALSQEDVKAGRTYSLEEVMQNISSRRG